MSLFHCQCQLAHHKMLALQSNIHVNNAKIELICLGTGYKFSSSNIQQGGSRSLKRGVLTCICDSFACAHSRYVAVEGGCGRGVS